MVELEVFWPKMPSGGPQNGLLLPQLQFFTFFSLKLTNFDKNGLQNPLLPQVNSLYMDCGSSTDQYEVHKNFKRRPGWKKRAAKLIFFILNGSACRISPIKQQNWPRKPIFGLGKWSFGRDSLNFTWRSMIFINLACADFFCHHSTTTNQCV